jgi:Mrp family chromosome partitioning ATPase
MFGLNRIQGLCELLESDRDLTTSIYHLVASRIWILPAGYTSGNPLELLQSGRLVTVVDQLDGLFDWIIIDSPPILPLADTSVWMRLADGILLATRQGITEKRQLQRGLEAVDSKKLIGALVNSSDHAAASNYYAYSSTNVAGPAK